MATVGHYRIPLLSAMVCVALAAIAGVGRLLEPIPRLIGRAFDRLVQFAFAATPQPAFAFDGPTGFLDPQPGNQPISAQLYNHNRHEAHSHARASYRAI